LTGRSDYYLGQIGGQNGNATINLSNWKVNSNAIVYLPTSGNSINLDLSGWEFTDANISYPVGSTFNGANYVSFNLSNWKLGLNTDIKSIIQKFKIQGDNYELIMTDLDLSGRTDISGMFSEFKNGGSHLKLDFSNWNTSTITNMSNLFYATFNGFGEADVDLSGWDISNVTNGTDMMTGFITSCGKATLRVKGWNMTKLNQFTNNMSATGINGQEFNLITE
jgi:surface protein